MSGSCARGRDEGVVLVNVLIILALTAVVVFLMLTSQEAALGRSRAMANAAQAEALTRAGEESVRLSLLRDMSAAPETDHLAEDWARVAQEPVELATGRFELEIRDANARFNLNTLAEGGIGGLQLLGRLLLALDLPADIAERMATSLARAGPQQDLDELARIAAVPPAAMVRLAPHVDLLPAGSALNVNSVDPILLGVMLANPTVARRLAQTRERQGFLTPDDLRQAQVLLPPGSGFTSDVWEVTVTAEVDDLALQSVSLLHRVRGVGRSEVVVLRRRIAAP